MKRHAWVLLLAGACLRGDETALVDKLYAKLAVSFSSGRALGREGDYLLLANPGFPVAKEDLADACHLSTLVDQIPLPVRNYRPSGAFYSTTYGTILDHAEASRFQNQTDREKARLARRAVFDPNRPGNRPTPDYAAYLKGRAAWLAAQDALTEARTEHELTGKAVPPGLQGAVTAAMKAWESQDLKAKVEKAFATLDAYYAENVAALFTDMRSAFAAAEATVPTTYYPATANPPPEEWLDDRGWAPFSLTQNERSLAQGPGTLPLGDKAPDDLAGSVTLTLETKRVNITRPWLPMALFENRRWRLQDSGFKTVSTGNPADPEPGLMPLMVTGVLLSRKLRLTGRWQATALKALGPFTLSGTPSAKNGQMSLSAEGVQIIGFFCTTIPKCPDPDETAFRHK